MYNTLFLNRLCILTPDGQVAYDESFHHGVNIIRGQNSSGKSTIVRFIFFVLGGCYGDFVPEALRCDCVMAEVCINGNIVMTLKRYLEKRDDNRVNGNTPMYIHFGPMDDVLRYETHGSCTKDTCVDAQPYEKSDIWQKFGYKTSAERRSFSNVLFQLMGLPEFKADSNITMHQILRLIYLDQESPLSSLFFFEQFDKEIIRETVAEMLMGLYNQNLSAAKLERLEVTKKIEETTLALRYTGNTLGDPRATSVAYIQAAIARLTNEIKANTEQVQVLRQEEAVSSSRNQQLIREYERYYEEIAAHRKACGDLETEIQQLKAEQADTEYFMNALQRKMEALDRSIATRDYFDSLHLEYCPECLSKIEDKEEEGLCRLCKSPIDNSKGRTQAVRIRLELDFQIRESRHVMQANGKDLRDKEALLKARRQQLAIAQQQYDNAVHNVCSTHDEQIDKLIREIGYKEGDINQYRTMLEQAEHYESLQRELDRLKERDKILRNFIQSTERQIEKSRGDINRSISENGVYMLNNDQNRQTEFMNARDFEVNYKQNLAYISNQQIKLSASSAFYLKMAARFALLFASLQVPSMLYPRLMFSDNMEDKGMEPARAANFQRLVVNRLKQMPSQDYQLIFATSMIAPELDTPEYTIGEYYTQDNKTLKNV